MIHPAKKDIRKLTPDQLRSWLNEQGEKSFRASQIEEWLWKKSARSFAEMTNLPLLFRNLLDESFGIYPVETANYQKSNDGTIKSAFRLSDGNHVEGVLIPAAGRMTACISCQVGCSLSCKFCATGYMERMRNLDPAEIYDQVVEISRQSVEHYQSPLTNIVYMGMGEPLLNYANVLKSIELITSPGGLGMSPKRITVSTAGIAKMIRRLADDEVRFRLALSLHAANDEKRSEIMPINETNTLENLAESLKYFNEKTGNRITLEYILFDKFNDTLQDARELVQFARKTGARVNIIEYNPIEEATFQNTTEDRTFIFAQFLERQNVVVNIRRSRGKDIDAACGQLANKA